MVDKLEVEFPDDEKIPANLRGKTVGTHYNCDDLFDALILGREPFFQNKRLSGYAAEIVNTRLKSLYG